VTLTFPGESAEYRSARNELLEQEIELRRMADRWLRSDERCRRAVRCRRTTGSTVGVNGRPQDVHMSELFAPGCDTLARQDRRWRGHHHAQRVHPATTARSAASGARSSHTDPQIRGS